MQHAEVATGVRRLSDEHVNWYLIEDGQEIIAVDAGMPTQWWQLESALRSRGRGAIRRLSASAHPCSRRPPWLRAATAGYRWHSRACAPPRCRSRCPAFPASTAVSATAQLALAGTCASRPAAIDAGPRRRRAVGRRRTSRCSRETGRGTHPGTHTGQLRVPHAQPRHRVQRRCAGHLHSLHRQRGPRLLIDGVNEDPKRDARCAGSAS